MTAEPPSPFRYGTLWGVLALFLLLGTVAAAFFIYGLTDLLATGHLWDVPILLGGLGAAGFMVLLLVGILYRVDSLRGKVDRRMAIFD